MFKTYQVNFNQGSQHLIQGNVPKVGASYMCGGSSKLSQTPEELYSVDLTYGPRLFTKYDFRKSFNLFLIVLYNFYISRPLNLAKS